MFLPTCLCMLAFLSFSILHLALGNCPSPPRLNYGELNAASLAVKVFRSGTTLVYQCRPGYIKLPGKATSITCSASNAWSALSEFCDRRDCRNPGELTNGDVVLSTIPGTGEPDTKFGATAKFVCNEGFRIVGRTTRTCTSTGWSNAVPTCEVVICAPPPNIANGRHSDSDRTEFQYQNAVRYTCRDAKWTLVGEAVVYCTKDGVWSGPPPTCKVISCSDPFVLNAVKTSGFGAGPFRYGDSITFECKKGFTMKEVAIVICSENSEWIPELPKCVKKRAGDTSGSGSSGGTTGTNENETENEASNRGSNIDAAPSTEDAPSTHTRSLSSATIPRLLRRHSTSSLLLTTERGSLVPIVTVLITKWLVLHSS